MATGITAEEEPADEASQRRERYGELLAAILLSFLFQGIAKPGRWEQIVITVLLAITLVLAFRAAGARPTVMRAVVAVAAVVVVFSVIDSLTGDVASAPSRIANLLLILLAPPAIVVGVVRSLRQRQRVTVEAVFGVLCLYILLGMFFAFTYGTIDRLGSQVFAQSTQASVSSCLYYSFTTLTTVGYGDLTTVSNLGHTLSVTEALFGQIYLVTVVAVLVSNLSRPMVRRGPAA
jgi:Ion channel